MIRLVLISFVLLVNLQAVKIKCSSCTAGKEMARCDYYVARKHDLTKQQSCLAYADSIDSGGMSAKASWYYLLGGDTEKAEISAKRALKLGQHYASEYSGFIYMLNGKFTEAKRSFLFFKHKIKNIDYAKKDIKAMKHIYKNFDEKKVFKILFHSST